MAAREYTVKRRTGGREGERVSEILLETTTRIYFRLEKKADRKIRGIRLRHSINYGCIYKINHPIVLSKRIQDNFNEISSHRNTLSGLFSFHVEIITNIYIFNIKAEG